MEKSITNPNPTVIITDIPLIGRNALIRGCRAGWSTANHGAQSLAQSVLKRVAKVILVVMLGVAMNLWLLQPALAAKIEPYVTRYLRVTEPVPIQVNAQGEVQLFSAEALSDGQRLFEDNCKTCHVGGSNLPNPTVPLSLSALIGATPPRDTIAALIDYSRHPIAYDGTDEPVLCRTVPDSWLSDDQLAHLSAFILRAAEKAPGWGTDMF